MSKILSNREKADVVEDVCHALDVGDFDQALAAAVRYQHVHFPATKRAYSEFDCMQVFLRDRFTDRYSGTRLFNPGVLRLISLKLEASFPFQKNWKISETHPMYWELFPTIDHRIAVTRHGEDVFENRVTTSMVRNSAKAHWTLEELGWVEMAPNAAEILDGKTSWLIDYVKARPELARHGYIMRWVKASERALLDLSQGANRSTAVRSGKPL